MLLCCGRAALGDTHRAHLRALLAGPLDGERLLSLARQHKMIPLLHRHLSALDPDGAPLPWRGPLAQQARASGVQALLLTGELLRLLAVLRAGGVHALALKGPTLAASLYGSPALRQFGDLDLWVDPADIPRACDLLAAHGCRLSAPRERPAPGRAEAAFVRFGSEHTYVFLLSDPRFLLELHWLPAPRSFGVPLTFAQAWARRAGCTLGGVSVPVLGNADQLVFLAAHGTKHQWTALEWLAGIAEQAARLDSEEWEQAWATARAAGFTRVLCLALTLAHRRLEAPVPAFQRRQDPVVERLARRWDARLIAEETSPLPPLLMTVFLLRVREHWRDRFLCLCYLVFGLNAQDLDALPVGALRPGRRSLFLALLARPRRLLRKYWVH